LKFTLFTATEEHECARKCGKPILAAAKLGVKALVDKATGYEKVRPKDDLQKIFKAERRKGRKNV
jgi:hypothetical protein